MGSCKTSPCVAEAVFWASPPPLPPRSLIPLLLLGGGSLLLQLLLLILLEPPPLPRYAAAEPSLSEDRKSESAHKERTVWTALRSVLSTDRRR